MFKANSQKWEKGVIFCHYHVCMISDGRGITLPCPFQNFRGLAAPRVGKSSSTGPPLGFGTAGAPNGDGAEVLQELELRLELPILVEHWVLKEQRVLIEHPRGILEVLKS